MKPGDLVRCSTTVALNIVCGGALESYRLMRPNQVGLVVAIAAKEERALLVVSRGILGWTMHRFLQVAT